LTHGDENQRGSRGCSGAVCDEAIPVEIEPDDAVVNAEVTATWDVLPAE
jgi:hypothetical protein